MEVLRFLSAVAFIFVLASCSNNKSINSVFPENGSLDAGACTGQAIQNKFIVQWESGKFTVESATNVDEFKKKFVQPNLNEIRFVEYDRFLQLEQPQAKIAASSSTDSWGQTIISAQSAWSHGIYGQNVTVGIVDSFVDTTHPQLQGRIAINVGEIPNNGIDDEGNGVVDDYYGASFISIPSNNPTPSSHGTHVAGIISADPNFGSIHGMAPLVKIVPAQFISNDGGGSLGDAVLALQYAAARGAKIINASWGGAPCVSTLHNTFLELQNKGILVVVAAGNDGRDIDAYPEFPASFNVGSQITVAASSITDFMTSWSNSGFTSVHVAAPGEHILSTVPGNATAFMDGTSMAAPFVTGAAALLWSAYPNATAMQIKTAILHSVDVTNGHEYKVSSHGRINIEKALNALKQLMP
jgi:subtilisin family serine protease